MILVLLLLPVAFEQPLPLGASSAMFAGAATDWRHSLTHNPALPSLGPRQGLAAGYWRPHRLEGVNQAGLAGVLGFERWSVLAGFNRLGFDRYHETEIGIAGAYRVWPARAARPGLALGVSGNLLAVTTDPSRLEAVAAFDAGMILDAGPVRLAGSVSRFNRPRFQNGDELPAAVRVGLAVRPLADLVTAFDFSWERTDPELALGLEMRVLPILTLRCGGRYPPLGYAAGLELAAGPVAVEYAVRYHPQLRDSHILGLGLACW